MTGLRESSLPQNVIKIFDATPLPTVLTRTDGSLEYANPAFINLLGYDAREIYAPEVIFSHPDDLSTNKKIREQLHSNPFVPILIEKNYQHKTGRKIPGLLTIVAQPDENGKAIRFISQMIDLTEKKQTEKSLSLLTTLLNQSNDAILVINSDTGQIIESNKSAYRSLGYGKNELLAMTLPDICQELNFDSGWSQFSQIIKQQGTALQEILFTKKNCTQLETETSISYVDLGKTAYILAILRDITYRKQNEKLIWQQAHLDTLTNLPNRRLANDRLEQEIKKASRYQHKVAVLYLDLDNFKEVNDSLGHSGGDQLLIETAQRLQNCIREIDTLARQGGDEFTLILSEQNNRKDTQKIIQNLLYELKKPFQLGEGEAYVTTSIGVAYYPDDGVDTTTLFEHADQAMYAAKKKGKNGFEFFTASMHQEALLRAQLINDLRKAINEDQFHLLYQPIIDLSSGKICKAEALLRWLHPKHGVISPTEFIPLAEETGLICEIGDWVFKQAVLQVKEWRKRFKSDFQITINTSPVQYLDEHDRISEWIPYLHTHQLPGGAISIEITESVLMDAHASIVEKLLAFQIAGVDVYLDDFGTGYSSLSYLKKFDIDYLKIESLICS